MKQLPTRKVLLTIGTSLTRDLDKSLQDKELRQAVFKKWANLQEKNSFENALIELSAETHSLYRFGVREGDEVLLLATATEVGETCAQFIREIIEQAFSAAVTVRTVPGLQVEDAKIFRREGVQNLFRILDEETQTERFDRTREVSLNVTGGFKSVVPYLTIYGIIRRFPVIYVFERSSEMIVLPPLPLSFDMGTVERAEAALNHLENGDPMDRRAVEGMLRDYSPEEWIRFEPLFETVDIDGSEYCDLSAFGRLFVRDQQIDAIRVLLSPQASKVLQGATGARLRSLEMLLHHVSTPGWLEIHSHRFTGTDLTVLKPGNVPWRLAGLRRGNSFRVCLLYADHDEYVKDLPGWSRKDFEDADFIPWERRLSEKEEGMSFSMTEIIDDLEGRAAYLANEIEDLREVLSEREKELSGAKQGLSDLNAKIRSITDELESKQGACEVLRSDLECEREKAVRLKENIRKSGFLRRLRFLFQPAKIPFDLNGKAR